MQTETKRLRHCVFELFRFVGVANVVFVLAVYAMRAIEPVVQWDTTYVHQCLFHSFVSFKLTNIQTSFYFIQFRRSTKYTHRTQHSADSIRKQNITKQVEWCDALSHIHMSIWYTDGDRGTHAHIPVHEYQCIIAATRLIRLRIGFLILTFAALRTSWNSYRIKYMDV